MAIPEATLTIRDGALGIVSQSANVAAKVGPCSGGTANVVVAVNNLQTLRDTFGQGPRCDEAARTSSPHSAGDRLAPWKMLSKASCTPFAAR